MLEDDFTKETEQERKIEYQRLKLKLNNLQNGRKLKYSLIFGILFMMFILLAYLIFNVNNGFNFYKIVCIIVVEFLVGLFITFYAYLSFDIEESKIRNEMLEYKTEEMQEKVLDDVFENSIKMSYKYLDEYYLQIREQAQKGFFITICVSVFGAILIGMGIVSMFMGNTNPSYVTCASGVITEFIATIFFFMYNKTIISMSKYHNKLVLSHNISIALKVADTLPSEDKIKSKNLIISELLKDMNTHLIKSDSEETKN